MQKKYDMVATIGKYQDNQGNTKYRTIKIGAVFENDQGHLDAKIDALPTSGSDWGGWVKLFAPRANEEDYKQAKYAVKSVQNDGFGDSEIPF